MEGVCRSVTRQRLWSRTQIYCCLLSASLRLIQTGPNGETWWFLIVLALGRLASGTERTSLRSSTSPLTGVSRLHLFYNEVSDQSKNITSEEDRRSGR